MKWYYWVIIGLIGLNITTFVMIVPMQRKEHLLLHPRIDFRALVFSEKQKDSIRIYRKRMGGKGKRLFEKTLYTKQMIWQEIAKENPDTLLLNQWVDSVGNYQQLLEWHYTLFLLNVKSLCNEQQKEKLNQYLQKRMEKSPHFLHKQHNNKTKKHENN